jgi:uncharacterized integral membrane protein
MRILYMILVIVFALFIVTFSQQNLEPVQLKYYNYLHKVPPVPAYILIFASLLVGVIITAFWGVVERFRLNRTIRRLNKLVRDLRREMQVHEAPPLINEQKKLE